MQPLLTVFDILIAVVVLVLAFAGLVLIVSTNILLFSSPLALPLLVFTALLFLALLAMILV